MTRYWPMRSGTYRISSGYGHRPGGMHYGLDFAADDGTPIYAAADSTVAHIGPAQGFGQWIVLQHNDGPSTVYGHMWDAHATGLKRGDHVTAGQLIGYVGNNGQSSGPHLHFEVHPRAWAWGTQIDPVPWLATAHYPPAIKEKNVSAWVGDPVWLADVLYAYEPNIRVRELPNWRNIGHGDFGPIWGVMVHHTGNARETAESIQRGRPDLKGPLSNLHIAPDGTVSVVAAGICWHAGAGSYPGVPTNNGNRVLIGIEAAWPSNTRLTPATQTSEPWPPAQLAAMRDACAAICLRLGVTSDRVIAHKEYAGAAQGKWDPGNLNMRDFRAQVARSMRGEFREAKPIVTVTPKPEPVGPADDQLTLRWNCLGGQTVVEALAEVRDKVLGTSDRGKTGAR